MKRVREIIITAYVLVILWVATIAMIIHYNFYR